MIKSILLVYAFVFSLSSFAQRTILDDVGAAMKAGSSKELIKYCNANLEIKLNGKTANYSIAQAEVVLKDFFLKNPSRGFEYVHRGSSEGGLQYTIGTYSLQEGSYRVVMVLKKVKDQILIDTINLSRE